MERPALTIERAFAILSSLTLIDTAGERVENVEVSNVSYGREVDSVYEEFRWEETNEPYAVVNFKAINPYGLQKAKKLFREGDFQGALNNNLSMRMDIDKAKELDNGVFGTLTCREVEVKDDEGGTTMGLLPYTFIVNAKVKKEKLDGKLDDLKDLLPAKPESAQTPSATVHTEA